MDIRPPHAVGTEPTTEELAEHAHMSPELVLEALGADDTFALPSLDAPTGNDRDDSFTVADTVGATEEHVELLTDCHSVRPLISGLPERECRILHLRFYEHQTQAEIGRALDISQMQVSRLLNRTLATLRAGLAND